jgi:hypothetical protein
MFFRLSFLFHLSPRTLEQQLPTQRCYYAALGVRSHFRLFLVVPLCLHLSLFNHHHGHLRGHRSYTKLRHTVAARMYIRPPSGLSRRASQYRNRLES